MMTETITYTLQSLSNGPAGIRETLKIMSAWVRKYKASRDIRELALHLTSDLSQKDYISEVRRLHLFVRNNIRYVKDIRGVETLQTPVQTLRIGAGDCDDKSTLVASLLEALGHPTRFTAVGFAKNTYSHVLVQTRIGEKWINVECTENVGLGWCPPGIKAKMIQHN
jgi:transglutaminase-like putative cysteine protease